MAAFGKLLVIDKGGWRKEFALSKSLIFVGSDPGNDIVLDPRHGTGVGARHLQILYLATPGSAGLLRIINLGRADIALDPRPPAVQTPVLRAWSAAAVGDNTRFQLGDFTLIFSLDATYVEVPPLPAAEESPASEAVAEVPAAAAQPEAAPVSATDIGLELHLADTRLEVGEPLVGGIVVRNQGDEPAVQIRLALEGLDADGYEMGPGPILFPNAEKEVSLRISHSGKPWPAAGEHLIRIAATAPQAYPGQRAEVSRVLWIAPLYAEELRFLEGDPEARHTLAVEICNAGNTRSRYELLAEDADGVLGYSWLLPGEAIVEDAAAPPLPADERPEESAWRDRLASSVDKVRATGRFANAMIGILASLGSMLPSPAGPWLQRASNALRANQMRTERALNRPSRVTRSFTSLLPRQLRPARRVPATKRPPARQRLQMARPARLASCRTPFVEPGERLVAELRLKHPRRQGGRYLVRVTSHRLDAEGAQAEAPGVTAETYVQVEGGLWTRLLLMVLIVLLILAIALGLAYGPRQGA